MKFNFKWMFYMLPGNHTLQTGLLLRLPGDIVHQSSLPSPKPTLHEDPSRVFQMSGGDSSVHSPIPIMTMVAILTSTILKGYK